MPVLLEEEGISAGVVSKYRCGRPSRTLRDPGLADEVLGHVLGGQPYEIDTGDAIETVEVRKDETDRVRAVRGGGAAGS